MSHKKLNQVVKVFSDWVFFYFFIWFLNQKYHQVLDLEVAPRYKLLTLLSLRTLLKWCTLLIFRSLLTVPYTFDMHLQC